MATQGVRVSEEHLSDGKFFYGARCTTKITRLTLGETVASVLLHQRNSALKNP